MSDDYLYKRESRKYPYIREYVEKCTQQPIELGLIVDSSNSISHEDFQEGIQFLKEFVPYFQIGPEEVRVSLITYSFGVYPKNGFNLNTYENNDELVEAIGKIKHIYGNMTDTGDAIRYMADVQMAGNIVRPGVPKIAIVITDGNSQRWRLTAEMAEKARAKGIVMFAVGIGRVRDSELLSIAGDPSRVLKVKSYKELQSIKDILATKTCIKTEIVTTTPRPKDKSCGELNPHDVYFVFSPSDLGPKATDWTTTFIETAVNQEDLDIGFRYGVVSGVCNEDEGFDLDTYSTIEGIVNRVREYGGDQTSKLIRRLINGGYSRERGGRHDAKNVAVIVTRGDKLEALTNQVQQLRNNGITVYIADPLRTGVQVPGAVTLSGDNRNQALSLAARLCPRRSN